MYKIGLLVILINILLKVIVGFGLLRMAKNWREANNANNEDISQNPNYYHEDQLHEEI